jgi:hypothetical protein
VQRFLLLSPFVLGFCRPFRQRVVWGSVRFEGYHDSPKGGPVVVERVLSATMAKMAAGAESDNSGQAATTESRFRLVSTITLS